MTIRLLISFLVLTCFSISRGDVYNDNVVILLDASGSMEDHMKGTVKMDAAKRAITDVLKTVPTTTHVGLLVFSGRNKRNDWVFPLGPRDDEKLLNALQPIQPNGSTPLGRYVKVGADRLLQAREKQLGYGTYRLLVVTDGEANDPELLDQFTPAVIARGITMDVIGVAMRQHHALATMAHSYRRADDPASLQRAIAAVLGEISTPGDGGPATANAFALLEGIPDEVALSMIQALSSTDNRPIGPAGSDVDNRTRAGPTSPPQPTAPTTKPDRTESKGKRFWVPVVIIIAFYIFSKARRRKK